MAKNLDLLLSFFPFEKQCFAHTKLKVEHIGHPLTTQIAAFTPVGKFHGKILSIFPGSRKKEIERNLPLQLAVARKLQVLDPDLKIGVSLAHPDVIVNEKDVFLVPPEDNYELMKASYFSLATSGTVTLELALHGIPTVVNYAIRPLDCFIAQKIFRIHLPFYCIVNIILSKSVFPELFGPNLTENQLFFWAQKIGFDQETRKACLKGCDQVRKSLGLKRATRAGAESVLSLVDF